jgi:DNA-binding LacI/PurR family transcriptional regulator
MALEAANLSRVHHLAHRLEQDIQRRGLRPGEEYLTAEAAAEILGVSRMTANRAMNVLARKKVLMRYRSRGSFVGSAITPQPASEVCSIHLLTFVDDNPGLQIPAGKMLLGLHESIPAANLQTHTIPLRGALASVMHEVESAQNDSSFGGFVLVLGTHEVQHYLAQSGLPTVVNGSVYPGIRLPFVEVDQNNLGRIMARQAINAGHRRLVFVNREVWRQGDEVAFNGMLSEVHAAGLEQGAIAVRNTPVSPEAVAAAVRHWLDELETPVALLCREVYFAQVVLRAAFERGLRIPQDVMVVYDGTYEVVDQLPDCPSVRSRMGLKEQFAVIGRMLSQMASGRLADPEKFLLPVIPYPRD